MKKSLKKQAVFPVLMLLVVTALALIGSSFAWFSMSQTAEVNTISGQIEDSSIGLMISKDARNFSGTVTMDKDAVTFVNPYRFHQVSTINATSFFDATITEKNANGSAKTIYTQAVAALKVPAAGKLAGWYNTGEQNATDQNLPSGYQWNGQYAQTPIAETDGTAYKNQAGYMVFDLFFSVEKASTLYLNNGTTFSTGNTANNAMRVAFLDMGGEEVTSTSDSDTVASTVIGKTAVEGDPLFWHPTATSNNPTWYGIKQASGSSNTFAPYVENTTYAEQVTGKQSSQLYDANNKFDANDTMSGISSVATLVAGVNKLRVVVWLEGNDASCTVSVAKLAISFKLNFFAKEIVSQQNQG